MPKQPLAEVFGFPVDNNLPQAERYRRNRLCPYNNKVPSCTKDSVTDPLGVCSIFHGNEIAVICPVRLRQDWLIAEQAAAFFFPDNCRWTTLVEVRLKDKHGMSAGNIDIVIVAYNEAGQVTDFGALEIQSVYISGNLRKTFKEFSEDNTAYLNQDWEQRKTKNPRPDYLSSSRKRLAPQLIYKGGILKSWERKQAVAVHSAFYNTLPKLPEVSKEDADIAWLIYDLIHDEVSNRYNLSLTRTVYTQFKAALDKITLSEAGSMNKFIATLQMKLDAKLEGASLASLADNSADTPADEPDIEELLENL